MAIAPMQKVMIVAHQSQVADLLTAIQDSGRMQILDAQRAMVTKEWPELHIETRKPKDLEDMVTRLEKEIGFLESHAAKAEGGLFSSKTTLDSGRYSQITTGSEAIGLLEEAETAQGRLQQLASERDNLTERLDKLHIWRHLDTPVEELGGMKTAVTFVGLLAAAKFADVSKALSEAGAMVQVAGETDKQKACIIVALASQASDISKLLRNAEFETVSFEGMRGTPADMIERIRERQQQIDREYEQVRLRAVELAESRLDLKVLYDHYVNLLNRRNTLSTAPATEHAVFFEGWIKRHDYLALEEIVSRFDACSVAPMEPAEGEEPPIEIENAAPVRPFETITRLYGTPAPGDVDPTVFLAPFFALFFGLCLTDAAYGLILVALLAWVLKKMKGDKKALWMLMICSVLTILAGAITGSWFADAVQTLLPQGEGSIGARLDAWRRSIMLFDPMTQPLIFIGLSLGLGYIQVLFGLAIAFVNLLKQGKIAAAIYEKLTWLVLLNSLLVVALAGSDVLPAWMAKPAGFTALIMSAIIFWFTERHGGLGARIGGGTFAVFSTVFYLGDMLSYVRIMALGMVTAGLGMAVNILTQLLMDIPYVGFILGLLLFIFGHTVNIALSLLSAFVHSLRLQFVEFFPKFFAGGGREFQPLRNDYKHVTIVPNQTK